MRKTKKRLLLFLLPALLLSGCGGGGSAPERVEDSVVPVAAESETESRPETEPEGIDRDLTPYEAPAFLDAVFHDDLAEGDGNVRLDLSAVSEGYVAVSAESESRLKFQVLMGEDTYNYDLPSDGTPAIFPLTCGNGEYRFRVMENIEESKYAEMYSASCDVTMPDEFQPYLRPSEYVPYSESSACVRKAAELASRATDALDVVAQVYDYVCESVAYDTEKASGVQSGYLPDPDETMRSGRGICFDYAALAAAMLRSQGIPAKMIFGYVSPDDLYHAWNMFYTEESGWVTVSYEVRDDTWNRLDLTFSANGADADFIGDGGNYADIYTY